MLLRGRLFRCRQWSGSVDTESIVSGNPENRGVAFGILSLASIELEIPLGGNSTPHLPSTYVKIDIPFEG